jgi:cytoskeletal protein RodZ
MKNAKIENKPPWKGTDEVKSEVDLSVPVSDAPAVELEITDEANDNFTDNVRSSCGTQLKEARLKANCSLQELSEKLKIRKLYLKAIEDGDWHLAPSAAYVRGYIRLYCNYFGIDYSSIIQKARAKTVKIGDALRNKQVDSWQQHSSPPRWLIYLSFFAILLIFSIINYYI